ncbi:MAG: type II toxin-antitoxin system Phd/YefM family antitoxin [Vulcanimicrobiaceae bacterium]
MDEAISAADANRSFSRLLRRVREGHSYVVTSHGEPVAKLTPVGLGARDEASARAALLERLLSQEPVHVEWRRDDLYDDAP